MPVIYRRKTRPRRKPGERANLSPGKIIVAALDVLDSTGFQDFSARSVAKVLGVSSAAIYAHFEGGIGGLKAAMVDVTLRDVARPYGPNDTPAGYVRDIFLRLLKAIHGKRPLAQLVAVELSAESLVCPIFAERLLAAALTSGKAAPNPARTLDLVLAMLLGMIMVEAEVGADEGAGIRARNFSSRTSALPPDEVPTLLANRDDLTSQIGRRLVPSPKILIRTANWYAEPVIAALELR